ncbi:unnamed protein product [Protopolystoma xenopodis]|uniref:Uncharacterized protein n=1 Tax=Protopolystoma xenopodis TaxID=117903 RepID=A0A448WGI8_9PLAT|nr:unnamed protein product [Protopolystoma xenopodis]
MILFGDLTKTAYTRTRQSIALIQPVIIMAEMQQRCGHDAMLYVANNGSRVPASSTPNLTASQTPGARTDSQGHNVLNGTRWKSKGIKESESEMRPTDKGKASPLRKLVERELNYLRQILCLVALEIHIGLHDFLLSRLPLKIMP